jgi:hypothetical protein
LIVMKNSRFPVHVMYGGAHLFKAETPQRMGQLALRNLMAIAPEYGAFALRLGGSFAEVQPQDWGQATNSTEMASGNSISERKANLTDVFARTVYERMVGKLETEPVEDFRIDYEDGYGIRPDEEEDNDAISASGELARSFQSGTCTPFTGFRIKSLGAETRERAERTLALFIENLLGKTGGELPANFVVTLPKVADGKHVRHLRKLLGAIEKKHSLPENAVGIEIMVETPEAVLDRKGRNPLRRIVKAGHGRVTSAHFGAYDYTAALGIAAEYQHLRHPACDFARQSMLAALAGGGLRLSDSVTTQLPVVVHKGEDLTADKIKENDDAVAAGWREHFKNVSVSMSNGFYQSWDLHPNQLPARYAAVYAFFLSGLETQAARLRHFIEKQTQAVVTGHAFDDAASARGLVNFFVRGLDCRALTEDEVREATGIERAALEALLP